MGQTVQLLENALRGWEDLLLIYEARVRVGIQTGTRKREELAGPVSHWRELRKHLLEIRGADFDASRFCYRDGGTGLTSGAVARALLTEEQLQMADDTNAHSFYASLPMQLASWTVSSRRVFHLSDELVERFLAADYSHYTWGDLLWPFDSFFIEFESPLQDDNESEFAGLLVSSVYGVCPEHTFASEEGFECLTFCTKLEGRATPQSLIDEKDRERLESDIRHKRWIKLNRRVTNVFSKMMGSTPQEMLQALTGEGPERLKDDYFSPPAGYGKPICWEKDQPVQVGRFGEKLGKIIAGLCLYLEALPPSVSQSYQWRTPEKIAAAREVRKIIIDGEQVCNVADFHTLSPETMTLFPETLRAGPSYSVTPHGRRGHWRRAPGQGNNPDAPRTIEVKPTIIHRDKIPEGATIGGAITYVK